MRRVAYISIVVLSLLSQTPQDLPAADGTRPTADGTFRILVDNGPTRYIEFSARVEMDGSTTGEVTLRDSAPALEQKEGRTGETSLHDSSPPFYVKAEFDCLVVKGNKAVMSGSVTESSLAKYVGQRLLLVVVDNGDGINPPARDKLTWGLYKPTARQWLPADSERPDDQGGPVAWIATDAERDDDEGVLREVMSEKTDVIGCQTFPLSSYAFFDANHGNGKIQVRP